MPVALIDGKCPVCNTPVDTVVDGVRMHFTPHDDPEWCREAAVYHVKMLQRALKQSGEDAALVKFRESYYRCSYAVALVRLEEATGRDRDQHRDSIEREVREDAQRAKERSEIALAMMKRDGLL